jgi:alkaline phosphatase D
MGIFDKPLFRRHFLTTSAATGLLGLSGTFAIPGISRAAGWP